MKTPAGIQILAVLLLATLSMPAWTQEATTSPLEGPWTVVEVTKDGKEITDRGLSNARFTFLEGDVTIEGGEPAERYAVEIEPNAEPSAFKLTRKVPGGQPPGWMIYSLDKDKLTLAFTEGLSGRPKGFDPMPNLFVLVLVRENADPR
jgi:uncharacterized protein (TIGR03067 family)